MGNNHFEIGSVVPAQKCCREIRLGINVSKVGDIVDGWNTLEDVYEKWEVVKLTNDRDNPILKRIL